MARIDSTTGNLATKGACGAYDQYLHATPDEAPEPRGLLGETAKDEKTEWLIESIVKKFQQ